MDRLKTIVLNQERGLESSEAFLAGESERAFEPSCPEPFRAD
jgi:hypothetical protein